MSKKWYNVFVSTDAPSGESEPPDEAAQSSDAAQTVARIAATVPTEPAFSAPVQNPTSFDEIYAAAEIEAPPPGYSIEKVATMLASEHLRVACPPTSNATPFWWPWRLPAPRSRTSFRTPSIATAPS